MADINDISELLGSLFSADGAEGGASADIDPELLIKLLGIVSAMGGDDANTALLNALRPLLREENRPKLDRAARLMKLMSLIPLLRDAGFKL